MSATLLIGLGNPGRDYAANRHNFGFLAVDEIIDSYGFSRPVKKFGGVLSEGTIGRSKVFAFRPTGYMNTSGGPAGEVAHFYKIPVEQIIVLHDELDLPLGKLRVKRGGGHGGHNGLKSLDSHLGKEYVRVRLGIGHPGAPEQVSDYVLADFRKDEWDTVEKMNTEVAKHIGVLIGGDEAGFMNKIALATKA